MSRLDWAAILARAAEIVLSYETPVTLRQLFYRLVAAELLPNTKTAYQSLSSYSAKARRQGQFPPLVDKTRTIHRPVTFSGVQDAKSWLEAIYRCDRTEGQDVSVYLAVEKNGIVEQLRAWFGELGLPILALGGYSSQSYVDKVISDVSENDRPAVLLYGGDFDPSGEDIDRDFCQRTGCFDESVRVALTAEQVTAYDLPPQMGKKTDTRAEGFIAKHGRLVQVELDALPPDVLHGLYKEALAHWWNEEAFNEALAREQDELEVLTA